MSHGVLALPPVAVLCFLLLHFESMYCLLTITYLIFISLSYEITKWLWSYYECEWNNHSKIVDFTWRCSYIWYRWILRIKEKDLGKRFWRFMLTDCFSMGGLVPWGVLKNSQGYGPSLGPRLPGICADRLRDQRRPASSTPLFTVPCQDRLWALFSYFHRGYWGLSGWKGHEFLWQVLDNKRDI